MLTMCLPGLRQQDAYPGNLGQVWREYCDPFVRRSDSAKGWFVGPWNSPVPVAVGFATAGINEKHYHADTYEIYLVARGTSVALVNDTEVRLSTGDMLVVEPHEIYDIREDLLPYYMHFVIHSPFVPKDKVCVDET